MSSLGGTVELRSVVTKNAPSAISKPQRLPKLRASLLRHPPNQFPEMPEAEYHLCKGNGRIALVTGCAFQRGTSTNEAIVPRRVGIHKPRANWSTSYVIVARRRCSGRKPSQRID